ncbi:MULTISPECIES: hypothetical protein [unclassified Bradyrhizobium]|uniref:hypothetical protein n=1 Tax=unclassified Bradyrhizobium TaxID=2631580 RepID=UPI001CD6B3EC|nr:MULTISPECIES: hypothetical protein [unclassified Bradyrhizobium]MCA1378624.1 hypothetical protein [Bradyrhizobium sp. IC4060]MCA1488784.1 hypothetical protein [Bradyrhizobium sp. IC4061]
MNNSQLTQGKSRLAARHPNQAFYGAPVGILLLERIGRGGEFSRPFIPGSVGNASTWSIPARYKTIPGLSFTELVAPDYEKYTSAAVQAAIELVREGAQMITANCGFMLRYQDAVRNAVDVPVLLSPLLLGALLGQMLPRGKALGIITAKASSLTPDVLEAAGVPADSDRVVIAGLEDAPCFAAAFLTASGDLDGSAVERETIAAAVALLKDRPDIRMLLFECSELPPYAAAVQRATGVPVFDFTSMIEFVISGLIRKPFAGID